MTPHPNDEVEHLARVKRWTRRNPKQHRQTDASLQLLADGLALIPPLPAEEAYANVVACTACLTLALRHLRAASQLVWFGYYTSSRTLLRAAYESASIARMLAKDPSAAEKWLQKGTWYPQGKVDQWARHLGFDDQDSDHSLGRLYGMLSTHAHPTARAATGIILKRDQETVFAPDCVFDEGQVRAIFSEVSAVAVFACLALRNSTVDETVLDPRWRRRLHQHAEAVVGHTLPALERDWAAERERYRELCGAGPDKSTLEDAIRQRENSWSNRIRRRRRPGND